MRLRSFLQYATLIAASLAAGAAAAQTPDTAAWTRFEILVKGEYQFGYKDASGRVRMAPRFGNFTNALRFRHVIAVSEAGSYQLYYLLKNGRPVGRDSVYMSNDYEVDCESEGSVRFKDRRRNRLGFLDAWGRVLIPARYNHATPFRNGLAVALLGARRTCWGGGDTLHCEHPTWTGGRQVLINQRGDVLADLATATLNRFRLNWYSLRRNAPAVDTATTVTLTSPTGDRYTFTDYDREFRRWFFGTFVSTVRRGRSAEVLALCFDELAVAERPFRGWPHSGRAAFMARYEPVLRARLGNLRPDAPGITLGAGDLNTLTFTSPAFRPFLTDCGEHFEEKYPVFEVVLTFPARPANAPIHHQEHFEFIRTARGYRLFSVSL